MVVLGSIVFVMRARRGEEQEIELRLENDGPPEATK
jgi:hypothetical protein